MKHAPIPMHISILDLAAELNEMGWPDYKLEIAAGVSSGYISQMKSGNIKNPGYQITARFYNFWLSEKTLSETGQCVIATT